MCVNWLAPPMHQALCAHPEALVSRAEMCVTRLWWGVLWVQRSSSTGNTVGLGCRLSRRAWERPQGGHGSTGSSLGLSGVMRIGR